MTLMIPPEPQAQLGSGHPFSTQPPPGHIIPSEKLIWPWAPPSRRHLRPSCLPAALHSLELLESAFLNDEVLGFLLALLQRDSGHKVKV
jgi:hypothetical protein